MKKIFLFFVILCLWKQLSAQNVGIGTTTPNASAMLDIQSNTKGLLIPRMTTTERNALTVDITTDGLMVYDTDVKSFFYHNTTEWKEISTGVAGTNYWTLASNNINNNNSGNVGIGISGTNITEKFQVDANMKVGSAVWSSASNDRVLKFGDASFVTIGETGQDDRMTLTGKNFIFTPSSTYTGYIGINTTTPLAPLSFGNFLGEKINFWNTDATHNFGIGVQGGLLQIHANDATADIAFGTGISSPGAAFTEVMRIKGNGKVGIGTTVPGALLEVKAISGQADLEINAQSTGDNAYLKLNKGALGSAAQVRFKNGGVNTWDLGTNLDDRFKIRYTPTNATIIDIDNVTNHIGIFTNSFTEAVNIAGNVAATGAFISTFSNAGFQFGDRTNNAYGGWNWYADNGKANLYRYSTGDLLTIDQVGNVGIGTTSPGSKLDVLGNVNFTGNVGASGASSGFRFDDRTLGSANGWQWYASGGKTFLYDQFNAVNRLVIDNTGNVGIGTPTPTVPLNVVSSSTTGTGFIVNNSSGYGLRVNNFGTGIGLFAGSVSSSPALWADNVGTGTSIYTTNSGTGAALEINGPIKVSGNKSAFVLVIDATNLISNGGADDIVDIDNTNSNNDPNAILFITDRAYTDAPISVFYNSTSGHWEIHTFSKKIGGIISVSYKDHGENNQLTAVSSPYIAAKFHIGDKINVLIIKQ